MKKFLHDVRFAASVVVLCVAVAVTLFNVFELGALFFNRVSPNESYAVVKNLWFSNLGVSLLVLLSVWLYNGEAEQKRNKIASGALTCMVLFIVFGFAVIRTGFSVGAIVLPIAMCFVTAYACLILMLGTRCMICSIFDIKADYSEYEIDESYHEVSHTQASA